ncbi:SDR family NAD(P)-dependent oxidoreductase [Streptomyces shenzhenensis]|uniref:SDR family NAD(P)-dependent oxidoreductase n=1 Tax=Streptomyces shenzhenensis TaxID=943815 RepID=UPI0036783DBE
MTDSRTSVGVAVVTGASSGIGAATARELAAAGFTVAHLARRLDRSIAIAEEIGNGTIAIEADVTDHASLAAVRTAWQDRPGVTVDDLGRPHRHARRPCEPCVIRSWAWSRTDRRPRSWLPKPAPEPERHLAAGRL